MTPITSCTSITTLTAYYPITTYDDETNSNDTSEQIISCNEESNSDIYQDSVTPTSPTETISFDSQSDLCRLEKKNQELLSTSENTIPKISISPNKNVSIPEAEKSLLNKDLNIQNTKLSSSESKSSIISSSNQEQSAISFKTKTSYNQKVEKGLICELSTFIKKKNLSNPIPDRQILENMLDGDDSTPGSALHLAHLFDKAKKTGQKEILPRTQIYNKMEPFLPGIKREYLHKKTQKARNIYTLFKEIGIDKIKQVTYSADAISSLTGVQIQNIIKLFSKKTECQKVISVKNLHAHVKNAVKKMRNQVINKLTTHFINSPKLDKNNSIYTEGEHQTNSYWVLGSHCPLCRENYMSLQGKWWSDNQGNKFYYLYCDNIKDPGIPFDEVLEAYSENSKLIQELKTQSFTLPIPWNNALKFLNKSIIVEA
ncbi:9892_t:CDS:2 [Cetraspora pellucida]|uniref:9892_t:CDS:1 n=2 Tax=Cetraspora pellucida TaxID=1433469 RepID=A0ACA9L7G8_9GLOM|nr:9891_t:CDS:2 [Cetraspora pellucida]CAG8514925.1 9892_t:CDS:2 [Cetraspora pellucida]